MAICTAFKNIKSLLVIFLRPHSVFGKFHTLNSIEMLDNTELMPDKWTLLIFLSQKS